MINNVVLTGRPVREPEVRETAGGMAVCSFTLAVEDGFGEKKHTSFIPVKVFGKTAENCGKYLGKGRLCGVQGKIQTGSYEKKDGSKVYTTDVIADRVDFIEWGEKSSVKSAESSTEPTPFGFTEVDEFPPF